MTDFDAASGSIWWEVEFFLDSKSGREKHTDITGQGRFITQILRQALAACVGSGAAFGRIRYWGDSATPTGTLLDEMEVGPYEQPGGEKRAEGLTELVRAMALSAEALPPEFEEVQEWARGDRDGRDLSLELRMLLWLPWEGSN